LLAVHIPPVEKSVSVIVVFKHTVDAPVIRPASGSGFITMIFIAVSVPQLLVNIYLIVSMPDVIGLTVPDITVASVLLLLHIPPVVASFNNNVEPIQILLPPEIVPALGKGLTVIIFCVSAVPHRFVST